MTAPKVLISDHEADVLESTATLVESLGYPTILVQNADDLVPAIGRERPGLVLQELRMPGLNVARLMATLRSNPDTADIPVVFFSAHAELPATAARYDAWGFLAKPFGPSELERLLAQTFGTKRLEPKPVPEVQRGVRSVFHDYWNLLAALNNYVQILEVAAAGTPESQQAVQGLQGLLLRLESKTDQLGAHLSGIVQSLAIPDPPPATRQVPRGAFATNGIPGRPGNVRHPLPARDGPATGR